MELEGLSAVNALVFEQTLNTYLNNQTIYVDNRMRYNV